MTKERFGRTKSMATATAIALVVAALIVGFAPFVIGHRASGAQRLGAELSSSTSTFTITSAIYPSPACTGSPALLYPGVARCAVFTVQNTLNVPITVLNITASMDPSSPAPPAQCAPPSSFTLPSFSGSVAVAADASINLAGVPIELQDSGTDQSVCENLQYHFDYSGMAQFTDATSTVLTSSVASPGSGQPVTLSATVSGANAAVDAALPSGTVTFDSCPTAACATTTSLGTGAIGTGGVATLTTTGMTTGTHYLEAVYGGAGVDYTGSTSSVVTMTSGTPVSSSGTTGAATSAGAAKGSPSSPLAFTGADIAGMTGAALLLIAAGTGVVIAVRRRRGAEDS
jgi:Bacterial Ig-like domain (group 3)